MVIGTRMVVMNDMTLVTNSSSVTEGCHCLLLPTSQDMRCSCNPRDLGTFVLCIREGTGIEGYDISTVDFRNRMRDRNYVGTYQSDCSILL